VNVQNAVPGRDKQLIDVVGSDARIASQRELRQHGGDNDTDRGAGRMQLCFGGAHIRGASTNLDGKLTGSCCGNCSEAISILSAGSWLGKRPISAVSRSRCLAELELLAQDGELVDLDFDDLLGRCDLAPKDASCTAAATTIEVKHADQAKPDSGNLWIWMGSGRAAAAYFGEPYLKPRGETHFGALVSL
jgi:hypothetical protein